MIAELYGKSTGCSSGKGGSMHLIDLSKNFMGTTAIVANSIPLQLVLISQNLKLKIEFRQFFGEGPEEGVFYTNEILALLKIYQYYSFVKIIFILFIAL